MKRLSKYFSALLIGFFVGLVFIVSGCGSLTAMEDSKESHLESKEENISNYPANIGLLEES